jgi:hypothetical protein
MKVLSALDDVRCWHRHCGGVRKCPKADVQKAETSRPQNLNEGLGQDMHRKARTMSAFDTSLNVAAQCQALSARAGRSNAPAVRAAGWLSLAAAPTYHGAAHCSRWRRAGYAVLGRASCVTAERDGPDVRADERVSFGALAEADLHPGRED